MYQEKINKRIVVGVLGFLFLTASVGLGAFIGQKIQRSRINAAGVNLVLTTNNASPKVNDTIVAAVTMDTQGYSVTGLDLTVNFDPNYLTPISIVQGPFLPYSFIPGAFTTNSANIVMGCPIPVNGTPQPQAGVGLVATITFVVKAPGTTSITFNSSTKVAASGQTTNVIGTMTPTTISAFIPTALPTPTRSPSPTPTRSPSPTPSKSPSPLPTASPSPVPSPSPSPTPTRSPSPSPSPTPTRSPSPVPTASPTLVPTASPSPVPSPSPTPIKTGDIDGDGTVGIVDIGILIDYYNQPAPTLYPRADLNGDGVINIVDIGIVIDYYGL